METLKAIAQRKSIRRYKAEEIPRDDLLRILEAARQAPSARNRQPWRIVLVEEQALRIKVAGLCWGQLWLARASALLVGVALPEISENWCVVDTTIAMQNAVLAATALGYGTCWIGAFVESGIKSLLDIPTEAKIVALLSVGVPAHSPKARSRKTLDELISLNHFDQAFTSKKQ
jgi:nitroreductase